MSKRRRSFAPKADLAGRHERLRARAEREEVLAAETVGERARIALEHYEKRRKEDETRGGLEFSRKTFLQPLEGEPEWVYVEDQKVSAPTWHLDEEKIAVSYFAGSHRGQNYRGFTVVERCSNAKCDYVGVAGVFTDLAGLGRVLDDPKEWVCPRCNPKKAMQAAALEQTKAA